MKKLMLILAGLAGASSCMQAEEVTVTTTLGYESEYIFRGVYLAEHYFAPAVDVSFGDYYAGFWAALPTDSEYSEEIDFYAGVNKEVSDLTTVDFGFTYYTYPGSSGGDTFELYSGISWEVLFSPGLYVYYDFDLSAMTAEFSCGKNIEFNDENSVEFGLHLGHVEPDTDAAYEYYGVSVTYNLAVTEEVSLNLGVNYYGATEAMIDNGSKHEFTFAASVTTGF